MANWIQQLREAYEQMNLHEAGERRLGRLQRALAKQREQRVVAGGGNAADFRAGMEKAQQSTSTAAAAVQARFAMPPGEPPQAEKDLEAKIRSGADTLAASRQRRIKAGKGAFSRLAADVGVRKLIPNLKNDPKTQELSDTLNRLTSSEGIANTITGKTGNSAEDLKAQSVIIKPPSRKKLVYSSDAKDYSKISIKDMMRNIGKLHNLDNFKGK